MALPCFLAMTAEEFSACTDLPAHAAWMACRFSREDPGLENLPSSLPPGSILMADDFYPVDGHDPEMAAAQLNELAERFQCSAILLDFQRPATPEAIAMVQAICAASRCPAAVSAQYAQYASGPVLLPPIAPHKRLSDCLSEWSGREIWLEAALTTECAEVTKYGTRFSFESAAGKSGICHEDSGLHCLYRTEVSDDRIRFTLFRTQDTLRSLLAEAERCGVRKAIGLLGELGEFQA